MTMTELTDERMGELLLLIESGRDIPRHDGLHLIMELRRRRLEQGWRKGDEGARSGGLIEAAFGYTHIATNYSYHEFAVVRWNEDGHWCDAKGESHDGPSDELPDWYRPFIGPPPTGTGG